MAKKRKHDSKSVDESAEPPQKQQKQDQELQELDQQQHLEDQDNMKEVDLAEYKEVEEEKDEGIDNQTEASCQEEDGDDDPIPMLLEPFGNKQLITLLCEAADNHPDIADRIRSMANSSSAHRNIFVHELAWDTTTETLIENFKQYGDIQDCNVVTDKLSGKSKGYGFILFQSRSGARKALKQPHKKIGNRMTTCHLATDRVTHVSATTAQQQSSEHTQRKIYISNVAADLDPQKLLGFFSKFGEIEEGPLGLDKATGKPKGFCFFVYRTVESARKALVEPQKYFEGRTLHCRKAIDEPKSVKSQHHHNTHDHSGYAGGEGGGSGHLMTPTTALNPNLGQARTALLALSSLGAGLDLNPALGQALLGQLGTTPATAMQGGYGSQANVIGGYGTQGGLRAAYPTAMQGGYSSQANPTGGYGTQGGLQAAYPTAMQGGYSSQSNPTGGYGTQGRLQAAYPTAMQGGYSSQANPTGGYGTQGGLQAAYPTAMQGGYSSQANPTGGYGTQGRLQAAYPTAMQGGYSTQANPTGGYGTQGRLQAAYLTAMQGGYGSEANVMGGYGIQGGLQAAYTTAMQGGYGSQANLTGNYGTQGGLQAAFPNQQLGGQGNAGRGPPGLDQ